MNHTILSHDYSMIVSGELVYVMKSEIKGDKKDLPDSMKDIISNLTDNDNGVVFKVEFNNGLSKCSSEIDSDADFSGLNMSQIQAYNLGEHCYNSNTKRLINNITNINREKYSIYEDVNHEEVKFTNEKRTIGGYTCFKAEHIRIRKNPLVHDTLSTSVWYSPELSLSYGPSQFVGYPGLVVLVEHKAYTFELMELIPQELSNFECQELGEVMSRKEYTEFTKKNNKNLFRKVKESMEFLKRNGG